MKPTDVLRSFLLGSIILSATTALQGDVYYWDDNAAGTGFGTAGESTGTWAAPTTGPTAGWSLSDTGANAFAGVTTGTGDGVNFGTASVGLASGSISLSGEVRTNSITYGSASGAITLSGGTSITMGGTTPTITVNNTTDTISTKLLGTSGLLKNGSGELVLSGTGNSFSGLIQTGSALAIRVGAGKLTVSGGTTTTTANGLGSYSADTGTFDQTGGTVNLAGDLIVGWNSGPTYSLSGGALSAANIIHRDGGAGVLTISGSSTVTAPNVYNQTAGTGTDSLTVNLNAGGTLVTSRMYVNATGSGGSHALNINLNGGTLKASAAGNLIDNPTGTNAANASVNATVKLGGAKFDTDVYTATIRRALLHDSALGLTADGGLSKSGAGTLVLSSGTSNYTGATTINSGVIEATILANGGGASSIGASTNAASNLVFGSPSATLRYTGTDVVTIDRGFTMSNGAVGGATIASSATGSGTLSLDNTVAINYGTADEARVLTLGGINTGANTFGKVLADNGAGATSLVKAGASTWVIDQTNSFTGGVTIDAGTLRLGSASALNSTAGSESALTFGASSTGTLALTGHSVVVANLTTNATPGTTFVQNANGSAVGNATLTVGNSTNASGTYAGTLRDGTGGGTLALTKAGTGTLTLSGGNSYTGATTVNAGILALTNINAIKNTASVSVADGATLQAGVTGTFGNTSAVSLFGNGVSSSGNKEGALHFSVNNTVWNAPMTLGGGTRISSFAGTTNTTLGAAIGGTGPLTISSRGGNATTQQATWTLNAASNYTGTTTIENNAGIYDVTVKLGVNDALPTVTSLNLKAFVNIAVDAYATLDLNGKNQTLAGLTDTGSSQSNGSYIAGKRVINSSATLSTLTLDIASGTNTYGTTGSNVVAGTIGGMTAGTAGEGAVAADHLALTKTGAGTLVLTGTNTYTGGTTLKQGTLVLADNSAAGATAGTIKIEDSTEADLQINSGITIANGINANSSVIRQVAAFDNNDLTTQDKYTTGTTGALKSSFAGGRDTTAAILAGTNGGSAKDLTLKFSASPSVSVSNDGIRRSDVFSVANSGSFDTFVLQLTVPDGLAAGSVLGWLNDSNQWVTAGTNFILGAYNNSLTLGNYGFDSSTNSTWAVVSQGGSYAAIPEPTTALAGLLLAAGLLRRRRA
jgi:fibronectin-binding autotransporter adhesin